MIEDDDYNSFNEDTKTYCLNWNKCNSTTTSGMPYIQNAFKYTPEKELDSFPIYGLYDYYNGGGYVHKFKTKNQSYDDIQSLFTNQWIDKKTRSLFVEFTLYNPNLNLFAYCSILFEFLPTGNIVPSSKFDNFDLYNVNSYEKLLTKVSYLIVVIFFMIAQIKKIIKHNKEYFKNKLNIFEWILYSFSMASLAMYAYKIKTADKILGEIKTNSINAYIRLQYIKYWNDVLNMSFAFCSFIGFIKMAKLLDQNTRIFILQTAIKHSMKKLSIFIALLIFLYTTFGQIFYIVLNDQMYYYSSYIKTLEVLFQMTLGKFDSGSILTASPFLGALLIFFFNVITVITLLNLFFAIIGESLLEIKKTIKIESIHLLTNLKRKKAVLSRNQSQRQFEENCSELIKNLDKIKHHCE